MGSRKQFKKIYPSQLAPGMVIALVKDRWTVVSLEKRDGRYLVKTDAHPEGTWADVSTRITVINEDFTGPTE